MDKVDGNVDIRKLPVIDDDKQMGIVTVTDIVNKFAHITDDRK